MYVALFASAGKCDGSRTNEPSRAKEMYPGDTLRSGDSVRAGLNSSFVAAAGALVAAGDTNAADAAHTSTSRHKRSMRGTIDRALPLPGSTLVLRSLEQTVPVPRARVRVHHTGLLFIIYLLDASSAPIMSRTETMAKCIPAADA